MPPYHEVLIKLSRFVRFACLLSLKLQIQLAAGIRSASYLSLGKTPEYHRSHTFMSVTSDNNTVHHRSAVFSCIYIREFHRFLALSTIKFDFLARVGK